MAKQLTFPKGTDVSKMVIASTTRIGDLLCLSGAAGYSRERPPRHNPLGFGAKAAAGLNSSMYPPIGTSFVRL